MIPQEQGILFMRRGSAGVTQLVAVFSMMEMHDGIDIDLCSPPQPPFLTAPNGLLMPATWACQVDVLIEGFPAALTTDAVPCVLYAGSVTFGAGGGEAAALDSIRDVAHISRFRLTFSLTPRTEPPVILPGEGDFNRVINWTVRSAQWFGRPAVNRSLAVPL